MIRSVYIFTLFLTLNLVCSSYRAFSDKNSDIVLLSIDSLTASGNISSETMDLLLQAIQRINYNQYYEQYKDKDQGPIKKLMDYCRETNLFSEEIVCINALGVIYRQLGKSPEAEQQHMQALALSKAQSDTMNMMISLNNLGVNMRRIDDLTKASDYHMAVLNLAEKFTNHSNTVKKSTCIALNSLGNINISLKQYDKAIEVFKQSNAIEQSMNSAIGQAINHANIGEAFELSGRIDSARQHYLYSLQFNEKAGSVLGIALCYNNLGTVYQKEHQLEQAISYYEKAIPLMRTIGDKYHLIISLQSMARARIENNQLKAASVFLNEANQLALEIGAKVHLKEGFLMLSKIEEATGRYKEALKYKTLSHQYSDSIFNEENQRHLIDIQTRYETQQKEQQIILLNRDNDLKNASLKYQRLVIWSGSLLFLIIAAFSWLFIRQRRKRQQAYQAELEQKLLRSQMNPHFIFNSLGAIQSFMMKNEGRKAAFYLSSFSSLMRSILKNSREEWITLQEEKQTLENYLNLHQLRLGEKLSFEVSVVGDLEPESLVLPPMLVQPFVENAILHGIEPLEGNGHISITFEQADDRLKITVEDNGKGIEPGKKKENHNSYALRIFEERVANLKWTTGAEVDYHIGQRGLVEGKNPGTVVTVKLPLKFT
jgi:tetratricopeptide (TPR) repeat protein